MSCNYAEGLSPYADKGKLGLAEISDSNEEIDKKVKTLCDWMDKAERVVLHTGAGISTAAGIPDFRGPNGVWTLEKKGIKPKINVSFDEAIPTLTHMAITELLNKGKIHYVVSQNIDALHLKSGLSRRNLAELHGNMFVDQCNKCERQFVRKTATNSVGQKSLNIPCPYPGIRPCRGTLHDTVLDWEHNLPKKDLNLGDYHSSIADLSICLGTTLQINPSGMLPIYTKKYNHGKVVICNLQSTKYDKKVDLVIHGYVDDILKRIMKYFNFSIPEYSEKNDPTRNQTKPYAIEWTLYQSEVLSVKKKYEEKMKALRGTKRKIKTEEKEEIKLKDDMNIKIEQKMRKNIDNLKEKIGEIKTEQTKNEDLGDEKVTKRRKEQTIKEEDEDKNEMSNSGDKSINEEEKNGKLNKQDLEEALKENDIIKDEGNQLKEVLKENDIIKDQENQLKEALRENDVIKDEENQLKIKKGG